MERLDFRQWTTKCLETWCSVSAQRSCVKYVVHQAINPAASLFVGYFIDAAEIGGLMYKVHQTTFSSAKTIMLALLLLTMDFNVYENLVQCFCSEKLCEICLTWSSKSWSIVVCKTFHRCSSDWAFHVQGTSDHFQQCKNNYVGLTLATHSWCWNFTECCDALCANRPPHCKFACIILRSDRLSWPNITTGGVLDSRVTFRGFQVPRW